VRAVSNVVIDLDLCGVGLAGQVGAIVDAIAAKVARV
jgi:hypothetical protein